ncbi:MAG: hypothetical protein IJG35_03365 [Bacteroidales bacterium]|nr:hypothetical protein [Bacteroidales bacterium]
MVRYNPLANAIEFSNNQGLTWFKRSGGRSWFMRAPGERDFVDMQSMGDKFIAVTGDNRTYVSDNGFCWFRRQ